MTEIIAALIGAVIGAIIPCLTLHFNYRKLFAETVSSSRMDWINVWRENTSIFLANAEILRELPQTLNGYYIDDIEKEYYLSAKQEMLKAKEMILTRLNLSEHKHMLLKLSIESFDYKINDSVKFKEQCNYIENLVREILKPEWERVKSEANKK